MKVIVRLNDGSKSQYTLDPDNLQTPQQFIDFVKQQLPEARTVLVRIK